MMALGRSFSIFLILLAFFAGVQIGFWLSSIHRTTDNSVSDDASNFYRVLQERQEAMKLANDDDTEIRRNKHCQPQNHNDKNSNKYTRNRNNDMTQTLRFGPNMSYFAQGASRTSKDRFLDTFDYGIRRHPPSSDEVLLLYSHQTSLPFIEKEAVVYANGRGIPSMSLEDTIENCNIVQVVSTSGHRDKHQCLAVVGQYESFTMQRWERSNLSMPFRAVQSGHPHKVPSMWNVVQVGKKFIRHYLSELDEALQNLKPMVQKVAKNNAVIVMVSNMGQADLLLNFVCSARAKRLDISSLVVFATDQPARDAARELGLTVYFLDNKKFVKLPKRAAAGFGDEKFGAMMKAKVVCVHMVNALGYDVLFQDLDVVWNRSPLDLFATQYYKEFDVLFQDEGTDWRNMAPHAANTGFYYVRHNDKTRYLLQHMLYSIDWVQDGRSHQKVMNAILSVHAAVFGLRVKTLPESDFPGGAQYHGRKTLMWRIVKGYHTPRIFHMSWTTNRDDKLLYMKQMGLWYVYPQCERDGAFQVLSEGNFSSSSSFQQSCCAVEPLVSCHYKDKPSIVPCLDSPAASERGGSFWEDREQ